MSLQELSSLSGGMQALMNLGKTQREVRRQLAVLQCPIPKDRHDVPDVAGRLGWKVEARNAATCLLRISRSSRGKEEVMRRLTKGAQNRLRTLKSLMSLADLEATASCPLSKASQSARLLTILLESLKMQRALDVFLKDEAVNDGAAGVRFVLKTSTWIAQAVPGLATVLLNYVERVLSKEPQHAIRLLELMVRTKFSDLNQINPVTLELVKKSLSADSLHTSPAVLHLIRAATTAPPPGFVNNDVVSAVSRLIYNEGVGPKSRCIAFATMPVLWRHYPPIRLDTEVIRLCVEVLLWKTSWQHAINKDDTVRTQLRLTCGAVVLTSASQKEWDVPVIIPHDDAYTIISLSPSSTLIPILRQKFQSAGSSYSIMEALMALIIDHSVEPDIYWPTMISVLIQSGVVDYLQQVAALPLPEEANAKYRVVQDAKREALIGIVRCFEQMLAMDIGCIGPEVQMTLNTLRCDESQPLSVQWQANKAIETWDR